MANWATDRLWNELFSFSSEVAGKYVDQFNFSYGEYIIKELATRSDIPITDFLDRMNREYPENYDGYDDIYLSILAGELRLKEAIPALLNNLRIDSDFICERAADALVKIDTVDVVREVQDCFLSEPWNFRLFAYDIFGRSSWNSGKSRTGNNRAENRKKRIMPLRKWEKV